jgi:uncharacterized protein YgiM (DUF1202 family)
MKRILVLLLLLSTAAVQASPVWVAVKKTVIRSEASNLSAVVVKLEYQDQLDLLSDNGDWWQVSYDGKQGWVHKSALSTSLEQSAGSGQQGSGGSIFDAFKGGSSGSSASKGRSAGGEDITLAGKGFNEDVEGEFKTQGANLNYDAVDAMENREVSGFDFQSFAKEGGLEYSFEQAELEQEESGSGFSFPGGLFK